ncbi:MAG: GOLPH3/VPS74 family protein [Spirochaetota bacterium]
MNTQLTIFEELLLLALRDEKGTVRTGSWPDLAIGGGILSELALEGCIDLEKRRRSDRVVLRGSPAPGHPLLARAVARISEAKRPASARTWVMRFAKMKGLRAEAAQRLVERGILGEEEHRILLVFTRTRYPERDGTAEAAIVGRVRDAVLGDETVDVRTAALVGVAHATSLLNPIFERRQLRARKKRIQSIMESTPGAAAANEAVQAVQAAIIAATVAASAAATSAASSS